MSWIWVLFLLISSCQRHNQWQCHHFNEKTAEATRILYRSDDPIQGIDVEMIQADGQLATYLQVHSGALVTSDEDPHQTEVTLITVHGERTFLQPYHRGEQRVRLTDALQTELISYLEEGNPITLELAGYRETIDSTRFQKIFKRLNKKAPSFQNKIHLY